MGKLKRSLAIKMVMVGKLRFNIVKEVVFWREMEMLISIKQALSINRIISLWLVCKNRIFKIYKINNSSLNKALIQIKVFRKKWINLVIFKDKITKVKVMCQIRPRRMHWWMKMRKTKSSTVILFKRWILVKESNLRELVEAAKDKKLHLPAYLNK